MNNSLSSGEGTGHGVEHSIYEHLFTTQLKQSTVWIEVEDHWTLRLPPYIPENDPMLPELHIWGMLVFVYIMRYQAIPPSVSPALLLAVVAGEEALANHEFVRGIFGATQTNLVKW